VKRRRHDSTPTDLNGPEPVSWMVATRRVVAILRTLKRHDLLGALSPGASPPTPDQLRLALEELGIAFVKLGQVLALRRDLLPSAYVEALESLHDRLPPVPWEDVRAEVERELGRPIEEAFAELDPEPMAAASVAQVHAGPTRDGRHVAVKVRRPGIEEQVVEDSAALALLATLAERMSSVARRFDAAGFVLEFRRSMERELDFRHEARNIRRFRESLGDLDGLWIPDVIPELSTVAVLTMEHSPGQRIDHYVRARPEEAERLAPLVAARSCARSSRTACSTPTRTRATSSCFRTGGSASTTSGWWGSSASRCARRSVTSWRRRSGATPGPP
jgi:ubiquinone biosynthesis protein